MRVRLHSPVWAAVQWTGRAEDLDKFQGIGNITINFLKSQVIWWEHGTVPHVVPDHYWVLVLDNGDADRIVSDATLIGEYLRV